mmetsp:Transcript_68834/g.154133  ORF Transcript_68834/g.154133 Transcript_68834/m.154133 type:complete len:299 (+) Transcript_68834:377-1273(+)
MQRREDGNSQGRRQLREPELEQKDAGNAEGDGCGHIPRRHCERLLGDRQEGKSHQARHRVGHKRNLDLRWWSQARVAIQPVELAATQQQLDQGELHRVRDAGAQLQHDPHTAALPLRGAGGADGRDHATACHQRQPYGQEQLALAMAPQDAPPCGVVHAQERRQEEGEEDVEAVEGSLQGSADAVQRGIGEVLLEALHDGYEQDLAEVGPQWPAALPESERRHEGPAYAEVGEHGEHGLVLGMLESRGGEDRADEPRQRHQEPRAPEQVHSSLRQALRGLPTTSATGHGNPPPGIPAP